MLFNTLPLLAIFSLVASAPAGNDKDAQQKDCQTLVESQPWQLSHLVSFHSKSAKIPSGIRFDFADVSKGLELKTECEHHIPFGSNQTLIEDGKYYPCANSTVRFMFSNDTTINIARVHFDPCLGPPGYQTEDAFGHAEVDFKTFKTPHGIISTSPDIKVPITELVA